MTLLTSTRLPTTSSSGDGFDPQLTSRRLNPSLHQTPAGVSPEMRWRAVWGVAGVTAATALALLVTRPELYRGLISIALLSALLATAFRWPQGAALVTLALLPGLALVRRLLIADSGWT